MRFGNDESEYLLALTPQWSKVILAKLIRKTQRESNSAPGTGLADPTLKIGSVTSCGRSVAEYCIQIKNEHPGHHEMIRYESFPSGFGPITNIKINCSE